MSIIVIDKATGLAVDPQVSPVEGDWIEETINGLITRHEYHETTSIIEEPVRLITVRAFMKRLDLAERVALRASVDYIVIDMMDDLRMAAYVDLDDGEMAFGLSYLAKLTADPYPVIADALIAPEQVAAMVIDGTAAEAYLGVL